MFDLLGKEKEQAPVPFRYNGVVRHYTGQAKKSPEGAPIFGANCYGYWEAPDGSWVTFISGDEPGKTVHMSRHLTKEDAIARLQYIVWHTLWMEELQEQARMAMGMLGAEETKNSSGE